MTFEGGGVVLWSPRSLDKQRNRQTRGSYDGAGYFLRFSRSFRSLNVETLDISGGWVSIRSSISTIEAQPRLALGSEFGLGLQMGFIDSIYPLYGRVFESLPD